MEISFQEACATVKAAEAMNVAQLEELRNERLGRLVRYAKEHSPLFGKLYSGIDPDNFTLESLPITRKDQLSLEQNDWFTDRRLTVEKAEEFLSEEFDPGKLLLGSYTALTTSGTSGKPMIMIRDGYHNTVHGAMMQLRLMGGLDPSLMNPANCHFASIICTTGPVSSNSSFLRMKKSNPAYENNMIAISVLDPIDDIVSKLNDFRPNVLTGYPSVLAVLAGEQQAGRLNIQPKVLACSAEVLTNYNFHLLRDVFQCPILNNYCSTEGGELAMSCPEGNLHINTDWVIIEPVDKDGKPVEEGALSDGVLVTDLSNFVQPVIRYHINDQVRISHDACPCGKNMPTIEILGRMDDLFIFAGRKISPVPIDCQIAEVKGLLDYQFVQQDANTVQFLFVPDVGFSLDDIAAQIRPRFEGFLAANGGKDIRLTFAEGTPLKNTRGGKCKRVLNLYQQ